MYINLQDSCCIPVCCVCAEYWIIKVQCLVLLGVPIIHGLTLKMHVIFQWLSESEYCVCLYVIDCCLALHVSYLHSLTGSETFDCLQQQALWLPARWHGSLAPAGLPPVLDFVISIVLLPILESVYILDHACALATSCIRCHPTLASNTCFCAASLTACWLSNN